MRQEFLGYSDKKINVEMNNKQNKTKQTKKKKQQTLEVEFERTLSFIYYFFGNEQKFTKDMLCKH